MSTWADLERLLSPVTTATKAAPDDQFVGAGISGGGGLLDVLLERALSEIEGGSKEAGTEDTRWRFVLRCLSLVSGLAESDDGDMINVRHQHLLKTVLELIVALGLVPYLLPGVGAAADLGARSRFGGLLLTEDGDNKEYQEENYRRLVFVTTSLLSFMDSGRSMEAVVVSNHFGDILAALLMLGHAPLKKPGPDSAVTEERFSALTRDQQRFRTQLGKLLGRAYPPLVVKHLIRCLQASGGGRSGAAKAGTPNWVKKICSSLLSQRLLLPDGVLAFLRGVLDATAGQTDAAVASAVAAVLAAPPATMAKDVAGYCAAVCPQLINVIQAKSSDDSNTWTLRRLAAAGLFALADRVPEAVDALVFHKIMAPMLKCRNATVSSPAVLPTEAELDWCVDVLRLLFVAASEPSWSALRHLAPVAPILLEMHVAVAAASKVSHLRAPISELLSRFLAAASNDDAVDVIRKFCFQKCSDVSFAAGDSGGLKPVLADSSEIADDDRAIVVVDLVVTSTSKSLAPDLFLALLADTSKSMVETDSADNSKSFEERSLASLRKNLMAVRLLGFLSEEEAVMKELSSENASPRLLKVLKLCISRAAASVAAIHNSPDNHTDQSAATWSLTLLSLRLSEPDRVSASDWAELQGVLADLRTLQEKAADETVRSAAGELRVVIATHGAGVMPDDLHSRRNRAADKSNLSRYSAALRDVEDPLLPVRGHGLIELARLVEERDSEAVAKIDDVVQMFRTHLSDADTYIYLQCINGLAACANHQPGPVVRLITEQFARMEADEGNESERLTLCTKLGEAMVRITRNLGELTPSYREELLNPLLRQINSPEPLVRASSLSNLGEVCRQLRFGLGAVVHEVLAAVHRVLELDPAAEARRAAAAVLAMLLAGLGRDVFFGVLRDAVRDIWRTLVRLRDTETDAATRVHVSEAIDRVNVIMRDFLCPKEELTKRIYVLDAPPSDF